VSDPDRIPWRMRHARPDWPPEDLDYAALLDMADALDARVAGDQSEDGWHRLHLRLPNGLTAFAHDATQAGCVRYLLLAIEPIWQQQIDAITAGTA
jgi:hypothetical protein